jgi:DNA-binding beta-propeller fold protein YncE
VEMPRIDVCREQNYYWSTYFSDGNVYVTDRKNNNIQVFKPVN